MISNDIPGEKLGVDEKAGYGYFFWRCARDNAFRGYGWGGQYLIVIPDLDACIAIMSHDFNNQALLDSVWDHVIPLLKESI